jgi:hypothetical protein
MVRGSPVRNRKPSLDDDETEMMIDQLLAGGDASAARQLRTSMNEGNLVAVSAGGSVVGVVSGGGGGGAGGSGRGGSGGSGGSGGEAAPVAEALLAARRAASKLVTVKGVTADGREASLSQTMGEHRMVAVEETLHAVLLRSGTMNTTTTTFQGPLLLLKKDLVPALKRLETRLERGHAVLAAIAAIHRSGGSQALAVSCSACAEGGGGSFWELEGVKLDRPVATRASDHVS